MVAQEQLSFLQVGLGQDPSQSLSNTLARQADQRRAEASRSAQAASTAITTVGTALSDYYGTEEGGERE